MINESRLVQKESFCLTSYSIGMSRSGEMKKNAKIEILEELSISYSLELSLDFE